MCRDFGGWGSLDGCSEVSSCCLTSQHHCREKLAGQGSSSTIATAVPTSSAAASATASTTGISSAAFAAAISIVLVYFVEAEQHGYVLHLLLRLVDAKCWACCCCQVRFGRCRSELAVFGCKTRGKVERILRVFEGKATAFEALGD